MVKLNRFQKWILKRIGINPDSIVDVKFNVNEALKNWLHKGMEIQRKKDEQAMPDCQHCMLYHQAYGEMQRHGSQPVMYLDPHVYIQGARQRATMHQVYPNNGDLSRHDAQVQRKKFETRKLGPETKMLPTAPQPHKPRLYKLRAEPDSTFNAL